MSFTFSESGLKHIKLSLIFSVSSGFQNSIIQKRQANKVCLKPYYQDMKIFGKLESKFKLNKKYYFQVTQKL